MDKTTWLGIIFACFLLLLAAPAGATTQYLVDQHENQRAPVVAGDVMVYEDYTGGMSSIFLYDFTTETKKRISLTGSAQSAPHTDGQYVVWVDEAFRVQSIYLYHIASGTARKLTTVGSEKRAPQVDYPWVVWSDYRSGTWEIYGYHMETGVSQVLARHNYGFLRGEFDSEGRRRLHHDGQLKAVLSGSQLVWTDFRSDNWDLYGMDLNDRQEHPVVVAQRDQFSPHLEGNRLVYQDNTNQQSNIYLYDFAADQRKLLTDAPRDQEKPKVSGDWVVWQDFRNQRWDIYGVNLNTGEEMALVNKLHNQSRPSISGNRLVYVDNSKGRDDIAWLTLAAKPQEPGLGEGIQVLVNGRLLTMDVPPILVQNRVLVPIRVVSEALGLIVQWDPEQDQIVLLGRGITAVLTVGEPEALVNGVSVPLDAPPRIVQGRTLVPLRFVGEAFGAVVQWDGTKNQVQIARP